MTRECHQSGDPVRPAPGTSPRPTLLPGLRRIWRSRHRLQLGVDPARAVVLELPDPRVAQLLDLLDGTRSERMVLAAAARTGIQDQHARATLAALRRAGLIVAAGSLLPRNLSEPLRQRLATEAAALALRGDDAPGTPAQILRRRAAARVVVTGQGPLAAPVAVALAQAGVGHVSPRVDSTHAPPDRPAPTRRPGSEIAEAITRSAPGTRTWPLRRRDTSFVVQVGSTGPANLAAAGYARHRLAHLVISVRDGTAVVGPLVPPTGGPCLNCLDLHRRDRDPDWPEIAAQLARPATDPCAVATVLCAAGLAAGEVLTWLDGGTPASLGASLEIPAPGQLRRRSWPPHAHCPCFDRHRRARPRR